MDVWMERLDVRVCVCASFLCPHILKLLVAIDK